MKTNNEIKIAIAVGVIMITAILIAIIYSKQEAATNSIDLKILKLYEVEGSKDQHVYRECHVTTDDVINLYKEYRKIEKLTNSNKVTGERITGNYKVIKGDEYIAFDGGTNRVYKSDSKAIYMFDSSIYKDVVELCTKSELQSNEQTQSNEIVEKEVKK